MKVDIDEKGLMHIEPETGLEAYALSKWAYDNFARDVYKASNIIINLQVKEKE